MSKSGSLCPAAKAADIIGDRWVLLLLRELMTGASRYKDFQNALPRISPTVLSNRLKQMEANGLLIKKSAPGEKATEYLLTKCGRELAPVLDRMTKWGLRWARRRIAEEDLDAGCFMWDFHRTLKTDELPDGETVFSVNLTDIKDHSKWWLIVQAGTVDLCTEDPGKEVDLYLAGELPGFVEVWMGDVSAQQAIQNDIILVTGSQHLTKTANAWFPQSGYSDIRPVRLVDG